MQRAAQHRWWQPAVAAQQGDEGRGPRCDGDALAVDEHRARSAVAVAVAVAIARLRVGVGVVDKAEDAARGVTEHVIAAAGDPAHLQMGSGYGDA